MKYTLGTAAKAVGKTKPTIRKAITDGRLTATRNGQGHYQIDPAELQRVYHEEMNEVEAIRKGSVNSFQNYTPEIDSVYQSTIDALKDVIKQQEARIDEKDGVLTDYKTRLAKADNLLTDQRTEVEKVKAALQTEKIKVVDIELPQTKTRKLSLRERIFGGSVTEVMSYE